MVLGAQDLDWAHAALVGKDWAEDAYDVGRAVVDHLLLQGKGRFTKLKCQLVKVVRVAPKRVDYGDEDATLRAALGAPAPAPARKVLSPLAVAPAPIPAPRDVCLLYTSPSPRDKRQSRMPSSA